MAVLIKKIKAATLMETLIATVLVVVVFMIASLTLNNIFSDTTQRDRQIIETHLKELHYFYIHHQLGIPYDENFKGWQITLEKENEKYIEIVAIHSESKKIISKNINVSN